MKLNIKIGKEELNSVIENLHIHLKKCHKIFMKHIVKEK